MPVTSVQSNSQPPGGMTTTQPVVPNGALTPADIQAIVESMTPIQARFRQQSSFLKVTLAQAKFTALGQNVPTTMSSVGLGVRAITEWNATITVANSATTAATFTVSPNFPFNLISNTSIQINGGATVYSASGVAGLDVQTRQRKGSRRFTSVQSGWAAALGPSLDPAIISTNTLGSNLTPTNGTAIAPKMSGVASVSVAASASSSNTWVLKWVTIEKLALDKDSLLGALPLQNNSTFVQIARSIQGALAGTRNDMTMPFYSAGASLTFTLTSLTADTTYEFCSVPADASLYQAMISNSYQVQEQTGITTASTGAGAFSYNIPQNIYLIAAHLNTVDSNGAALPGYNDTSGLGQLKLQYNAGSVIPVIQQPFRERAVQFFDYDYDPTLFQGYRLWDGEATSDDITASDNMGWLDTYSTASPQIVVDVGSSASTTLTTSVCREAVVAGAVQQIGG